MGDPDETVLSEAPEGGGDGTVIAAEGPADAAARMRAALQGPPASERSTAARAAGSEGRAAVEVAKPGRPAIRPVDGRHPGARLQAQHHVDGRTLRSPAAARARSAHRRLPLHGFPRGNGSEYINHRVARLLDKLHVGDFTKSRPRHPNDNALVETKNGTVVRHYLGRAHIPRWHAALVGRLARDVLSPFLNYHRPCHFPVKTVGDDGRATPGAAARPARGPTGPRERR